MGPGGGRMERLLDWHDGRKPASADAADTENDHLASEENVIP